MKKNFVILLKLYPSTPFWMFSWYVSKQLPCKHGVKITRVQRCFSVVTLKQHWIKVISTPCVYRLFIWTPIPACLWTPCNLYKKDSLAIHWKNPEVVNESYSWKKKLFLNFVININNLQFHPFLFNVPILYPLETIEDRRFSDVHRGYKRGTQGWIELKSLTCFFSMFPFILPENIRKPKVTCVISGCIKWENREKAWNEVFHNTNQGIHY